MQAELGVLYDCYDVDSSLTEEQMIENARAAFVKKYNRKPKKVFIDQRLVRAGPLTQKEIYDRGEKVRYEDGVGVCVWIPFVDDDGVIDEDIGGCMDFIEEDIDDLILLLEELRDMEAEDYNDK